MNVLRLVIADKEKKSRSSSAEFQKLEAEALKKSLHDYPLKFDKEVLQKRLTPAEYHVTQERGTERPFSGKYLHEKSVGEFTCVVCESILFRSDQKFESGCGWPSFSDVHAQGTVDFRKDTTNGMSRIEVTCSKCGAHLGHVFDDGPRPNHLRYCINSASLGFKKREAIDNEKVNGWFAQASSGL